MHYRYLRYYWYGCHPYYWYGSYPIPYEVSGDTYNYYTYNYYDEDQPQQGGSIGQADGIVPADENTLADVRERLGQQQDQEPDGTKPADIYFEQAVKYFEAGDYRAAEKSFAAAIEHEPDDMILPFAYAQALFANEQYKEAAGVIREALEKVTPEEKGVFYPRGLYIEEDTLPAQIEALAEKSQLYRSDSDLRLLLGYQLFGIGKLDEAAEQLQQAALDYKNHYAATVLLEMLEEDN